MAPVSDLASDERLGRRGFSKQQAKKAARAENPSVDFRAFLDSQPGLSVDRIDQAPIADLTAMADAEVPPERDSFYGWFVVSVSVASEKCRVEATPTSTNQYHADIWLPDAALEDRAKRIEIAHDLARSATWQARQNP